MVKIKKCSWVLWFQVLKVGLVKQLKAYAKDAIGMVEKYENICLNFKDGDIKISWKTNKRM